MLYINSVWMFRVKLFTVPAFTPELAKILFARVNHNKYLVTDKTAYIGTSNWSADYFISTAGIGVDGDGGLSVVCTYRAKFRIQHILMGR